jgi:hypothetical protein
VLSYSKGASIWQPLSRQFGFKPAKTSWTLCYLRERFLRLANEYQEKVREALKE